MLDPFATLGIDPHFAIDVAAIEARQRALSKALHPDRYAGAPKAERRMALSRSIEVNEAVRALRDPVRRAEALLARLGSPAGLVEQQVQDPDLLMEMMDVREELSTAVRAKDARQLRELGDRMRARQKRVLEALGESLARAASDASIRAESVLQAVRKIGELRYVNRFITELEHAEEESE